MNNNDKLRSQVIRLAHANPELRKDLLPLVTTKTASSYNEVMKVLIQILKREDAVWKKGIKDTSNQSRGKIELEWYGGFQRGWEVGLDRSDEVMEMASEMADEALHRYWKANNISEDIIVEDDFGDFSYSDKAQDKFNELYDRIEADIIKRMKANGSRSVNAENNRYRKNITKKVNQALAPLKSIIKSYSVDYIEKGRWRVQVQLRN